ncbi:hypothetical protein NVP1210O_27 [Vibrio phage 1.210.O._10N.222.52.C2]|nr:hypothetical protein NVP1210O_27 [Vibrio phage 1.210.O._10N.222.52.C2]
MKTNTVVIVTNVKKSQIKDTGKHWEISNIPVTVDDSVMNDIYYPADENRLGLPSLIGKPVTLAHPMDKEGNYVSGREGQGLEDFFSGGTITNAYNVDGVNFADARIKKSVLNAQERGEWYAKALASKEDIGVSTGLTIPINTDAGYTPEGEKYSQTATNQKFDHLAMLPSDEAPAGGDATFMRFNTADKERIIIANVDECMPTIKEKANLWDKVSALFATNDNKDYNKSDKGTPPEIKTNQGEVAKVKNEMLERMKSMNMDVSGMADYSELEMFNAYDEEMTKRNGMKNKPNAEDMDDKDMDKKKDKMQKNSAEVPAWAQSLVTEIADLKGQLATNAKSEREGLESKVAEIGILSKEEASELSVNSLKSHVAKNGGHLNVNAAGGGYHPQSGEKHALDDMEAPE